MYLLKENNNTALQYFLCSIESVLNLEDIKLILTDAQISMHDIILENAVGSFKNKKYVIVHSESPVKLFHFRLAFQKSQLNGEWFLNRTPPKQRNISQVPLNHSENKKIFNMNFAAKKDNNGDSRTKHLSSFSSNDQHKNNNKTKSSFESHNYRDSNTINCRQNQSSNGHVNVYGFREGPKSNMYRNHYRGPDFKPSLLPTPVTLPSESNREEMATGELVPFLETALRYAKRKKM